MNGNRPETITVNVGPQHPSTHGVLRLLITLEGETMTKIEPVIGYLHRGMEKLAESRTYISYLPMVDRIDYLSGFFNMASFCYAVESLANIEVPQRAEYIRLITMELNRIASHLLWLGTFMLDLGATSPLFYTFREREEIIMLFEELTGGRMMYNYYTFGGVKQDLPDGWLKKVQDFCEKFPALIDDYEAIITSNPIFLDRTRGIGLLSQKMARDFGITGVNLRASGVAMDLRKTPGYSVYNQIDFDIITMPNGDSYDRYLIRIAEMRQSVSILKQALSQIPGGSTEKLKMKRTNCNCDDSLCEFCGENTKIYYKKPNMLAFKVPTGEATSMIESPRGVTACYVVSDGSANPYRVKWRTPSFSSVQVLPEIAVGHTYADLMAIFGSFDVVLPEVDR